jgi:hypothetical protein
MLPGNEPTVSANALLVEHELDAIYLGHEMKSEGRSPLLLSNSTGCSAATNVSSCSRSATGGVGVDFFEKKAHALKKNVGDVPLTGDSGVRGRRDYSTANSLAETSSRLFLEQLNLIEAAKKIP